MSKRVISRTISWPRGFSVGMLAAATMLMLGMSRPTFAADCLAGPNRAPGPGGHWYYHFDRASDRKCWYLVEPPSQTPGAQTPMVQAPQPAPEPTPQFAQPSLGSFFSSLSAGFAPTAIPPNTTGDVRVLQPAPADEAEPGRQSRMPLAAKQHRTVHLRPPAEHAEERPAASPNQAERDALFEEFLRWRERQTP
jgi:hypothetical protein